jgi:hypothetical protein
MRIGDILYFAPGIRFEDIDLRSPDLPRQYRERITGFYIDPAEQCADSGHAFAAGVLLVSAIDALARLRSRDGVGDRFKKFAREKLPSFADENLAQRFYEDFRNGLVHEARLKNGAQFTLEFEPTVAIANDIMLINPRLLAAEVRAALNAYVTLLASDEGELKKLAETLAQDHASDFAAVYR